MQACSIGQSLILPLSGFPNQLRSLAEGFLSVLRFSRRGKEAYISHPMKTVRAAITKPSIAFSGFLYATKHG